MSPIDDSMFAELDPSAKPELPTPPGPLQGLSYAADIVLCIDATASMGPVIDPVKTKAQQLPKDLLNKMEEKGKNVSTLRIKVVVFRDVFVDSEPFRVSDFFNMPDQTDDFQSFMTGVYPDGGGDEPESGLEAVAIALNSDWTSDGDKRRHLVVVWSDASAHPIERSAGKIGDPLLASQVPDSMSGLEDMWHGSQTSRLSQSGRRMVLFVPEASPWTELEGWDEVIMFPSEAGRGLEDFEYDEILDLIAGSI